MQGVFYGNIRLPCKMLQTSSQDSRPVMDLVLVDLLEELPGLISNLLNSTCSPHLMACLTFRGCWVGCGRSAAMMTAVRAAVFLAFGIWEAVWLL